MADLLEHFIILFDGEHGLGVGSDVALVVDGPTLKTPLGTHLVEVLQLGFAEIKVAAA